MPFSRFPVQSPPGGSVGSLSPSLFLEPKAPVLDPPGTQWQICLLPTPRCEHFLFFVRPILYRNSLHSTPTQPSLIDRQPMSDLLAPTDSLSLSLVYLHALIAGSDPPGQRPCLFVLCVSPAHSRCSVSACCLDESTETTTIIL